MIKERKKMKRAFVFKSHPRLAYPEGMGPEVLNLDCWVMDLSRHGIKMVLKERTYQCPAAVQINSSVPVELKFHDGEVYYLTAKILRCYEDIELGRTCFAGYIEQGIDDARIARERAFIAKEVFAGV